MFRPPLPTVTPLTGALLTGVLLAAAGPAAAQDDAAAEAAPATPVEKFVTPVGGEPGADWAVVNYVDVAPAFREVRDARGGDLSYDRHEGMDFALPHFAAMDAGVPVRAAAGGVVVAAADGHPDRNRLATAGPKEVPAPPPNFVRIEHPGGVSTGYLHLKKGSVTVAPGDRVTAGQTIGQVGSSGRSSGPHLHFEVRTRAAGAVGRGAAVATLANPARWWKAPLPYAGETAGVLDHGVSAEEPTDDGVAVGPPDAGPFPTRASGDDPTAVWVWASLHGMAEGDRLEYRFRDPRGRTRFVVPQELPEVRFGWWSAKVELPDPAPAGRWTVKVTRNGDPLFDESFRVSSRRRR